MENSKQWKIIVSVLAKKGVDVSCITIDTTFTSLNLDSLDVFSMIMQIEKDFSIEFKDDDLAKISTIKEAIELLEKYIY